jgi:predicted TIM-barrel fold metal-dependent hydrolase
MPDRADAHIHLFEKGYRGSFTGRDGVRIDETALYASLARDHGVKQALIVGYEGEDWARGNNAHIAKMAEQHAWCRPVGFVHLEKPGGAATLEEWHRQRFVGVSLYVFGDEKVRALHRLGDDFWEYIAQHHWLVSLNSRGKDLAGWTPILKRHPQLRLIVSHLGLPPAVSEPPAAGEARMALGELLELGRFTGVHVKLSGFYALTRPGYAYPHRSAWPYVQVLLEAFGAERLLWGSDFTPCLDNLTFPQTVGMFSEMAFLSAADRERIEGGNLLRLLEQTK